MTATLNGTCADCTARSPRLDEPDAAASGRFRSQQDERPSSQDTAQHASGRGPFHRNEVLLVGRLSGQVQRRCLRSGAVVFSFRVVVRRDHATGGTSVDAMVCVA